MSATGALPGQRWVSDAEPELGLGSVVAVESGILEVDFPAAEERRRYAMASAPLRRVSFVPGDTITARDGGRHVVEAVETRAGLLVYRVKARELPESELSDTISYSKPEDRLFGGQHDRPEQFDLRVRALHRLAHWRASPLRGLIGPRMDLIPHQLAIATEVSGRIHPRVLLADEVGLGKTIEACLIVHRLLLTRRIARVLILVPDALVHQWYVELLRRFNLNFCLFDADRIGPLGRKGAAGNPFLEEQLVIAGMGLLTGGAAIAEAAVEAGWDLMVVDEAHHLEWSPEQASPAYRVVEALARVVPSVLLLTATPQQLGLAGHFGRLRLLDPERYPDLGQFAAEVEEYNELARWVEKMEVLPERHYGLEEVPPWGGGGDSWQRYCDTWEAGEQRPLHSIIEEVVEAFGPGRVIFRNTRTRLAGFPKRKVHLVAVKPANGDAFAGRIDWLLRLLGRLKTDKALLICRARELAEAIIEAISARSALRVALFHEGLSLLQRDRYAAYFADPAGAQLLVCSEMGSEGRNFQFAHHLVLWDLPEEPDLLEQRIGRLDRIGQKARIHLHVPYVAGEADAAWARWYDEGLGCLAEHVPGAHLLGERFIPRLRECAASGDETALQALIDETARARRELAEQLRTGRDRLLAVGKSRKAAIDALIDGIHSCDTDHREEGFIVDLLEEIGVQVNEEGPRCFHLEPVRLKVGSLPFLPQAGMVATFSREDSLSREDRPFLTIDHPLVETALEVFLGEEAGNASAALWVGSGDGIFLETVFIAECVAPTHLHLDRFFPPAPICKVMNHQGEDCSAQPLWRADELQPVSPQPLLDRRVVRERLIPNMLQKARAAAEGTLTTRRIEAAKAIRASLDGEISRLRLLSRMNRHVRPAELDLLEEQKAALLQSLENAHLRLDAIRLVWMRAP